MLKLPFGRKDADKPSRFLTIDIGSNTVKVMAFGVRQGEKNAAAEVIGFSTKSVLEDSTRAGVIVDINDVEQALSAAISEVTDDQFDITDVVFGVSGSLSVGLMTTVRVVRGREDPISEKEISAVLDRTYQAAYEQAQNVFLEMTGNDEEEFQMIASSVVYTRLDDQEVKDLEGQHGQKVEIAVFTAFSPSYHLNTLEELADKLGLDVVAIGPSTYALAKSLSYVKGPGFDGVLMDVGGEITDVGVVFGGGIVFTRSIDIGGAHFTKVLASGMDMSFKDAEHKKLEYSFGRIPESEGILIKGYMDNLLDLWLDGIELLFQNFSGVKTFAPNIYLVGGGAELPDIYEVVTKEPWAKSIPFKSPPEFSKLVVHDLPLVSDSTAKATTLDSIVPAALSVVYLEAKGLIT